jgi:hypothetical protein
MKSSIMLHEVMVRNVKKAVLIVFLHEESAALVCFHLNLNTVSHLPAAPSSVDQNGQNIESLGSFKIKKTNKQSLIFVFSCEVHQMMCRSLKQFKGNSSDHSMLGIITTDD